MATPKGRTPAASGEFQRARSDEQREIRRQAILRVAADMVAEMPVAELSLNELSRRVGLAKSNVLRYFESREAVLLELLDSAWRDWPWPPREGRAPGGGGGGPAAARPSPPAPPRAAPLPRPPHAPAPIPRHAPTLRATPSPP